MRGQDRLGPERAQPREHRGGSGRRGGGTSKKSTPLGEVCEANYCICQSKIRLYSFQKLSCFRNLTYPVQASINTTSPVSIPAMQALFKGGSGTRTSGTRGTSSPLPSPALTTTALTTPILTTRTIPRYTLRLIYSLYTAGSTTAASTREDVEGVVSGHGVWRSGAQHQQHGCF